MMGDTFRPRVLVIDDEPDICEVLEFGLGRAGFLVRSVSDGRRALAAIAECETDVVVLDVMLPGRDGFALLPELRRFTEAPVVMLSALHGTAETVRGLGCGADHYVAKPFVMDELVARLHSALRRPRLEIREVLRYDDLTMDVGRRAVSRGDVAIKLSHREFTMLESFLRAPERVFTRQELLQLVWGTGDFITAQIVDTYVSYLRAKIDANAGRRLIHTVRGVGYALRTTLS